MEQNKIIKLLEFLTQDATIQCDTNGIVIKNFQYSTNIKIEGLPDYNYKVEFALKTENNPFKKLGENKGESFVLPFSMMEGVLKTIEKELNIQNNKVLVEKKGYAFFNQKKEEILNVLNSNVKIEEEFQYYVVPYATKLFNNVILIEKHDNENRIFNHEFIKLSYTYIDYIKEENNGLDPTYTTKTITVFIPAIDIEKYIILKNHFTAPVKNDYESLIDILRKNNQDDNMSKLLLYTKLDSNFPDKQTTKPKKI